MSKIKRTIQIVLLLVVAGSVGYLIAKEYFHVSTRVKEPVIADAAVFSKADARPDRVVVYYFHGNFRCVSCKKIELYAKESIELNFSRELKNGTLTFKIINVEEPENRHYIGEYELYSKSLVVAAFAGDKEVEHKNLDEVWRLLGSKTAFENYVKSEVSVFLNGVSK